MQLVIIDRRCGAGSRREGAYIALTAGCLRRRRQGMIDTKHYLPWSAVDDLKLTQATPPMLYTESILSLEYD